MSRPPALTAERNSAELPPMRRPSMSRMPMARSPWLSGLTTRARPEARPETRAANLSIMIC